MVSTVRVRDFWSILGDEPGTGEGLAGGETGEEGRVP